ncbi:FtsX-like permease family protein [Entomoplasma freundtii]|uniref:ABC transporter permease n=1 Tax=Entomoplasma freundtii TaxID=74700 RepID=A0A2K8NRB9_9MOLU|nr:ABC transporter permease [Entomoplasma freundtii]ATZ16390.1 ABC transporter permease [Entomoplasma freundtii]TDY56571.1 FtsX-like permease family protein [Entomoplasma freundtii]
MHKRTPNFLLLLKQGFRGIFKFKIQFIIILVLSFLATFVLTITASANRRLHQDWDQIVGSVDPFDYVGTTQLDNTATRNDGAPLSSLEPVPLVDFLNNTFVDVVNNPSSFMKGSAITPHNETTHNSNFNFVLNDSLYKDQLDKRDVGTASTFLTRFMKDTTDQGFYALTKILFNKDETNGDNLADYRFNIRNKLADNLIKDIVIIRDQTLNQTNLESSNFALPAQVNYLRTSALRFFVCQQPEFFAFLKNGFPIEDFENLLTPQKLFIDYLYDTVGQIAFWITDQGLTDNTKFREIWSTGTGDEKAQIFYQFLMGESPTTTTLDNGSYDFIPPTGQGYALEATIGEALTTDEANNKFLIVGGPTDKTSVINALSKKGYRGMMSPMNVNLTTEDNPTISSVTFTERYNALTLQNSETTVPFTKRLTLDDNFYLTHPLDNKNFGNPKEDDSMAATMWQYHMSLTAWASGYDIQFRKEQILFDNITSRKFRFVLINGSEEANFTILRGTRPTAKNEIAISPQFAKANHLKVGDYLKIGQAPLLISGFATDTYSFFPAVDPNVPIPQAKTEAYIYGSKETLHNAVHGFGGNAGNQDMSPRYFHFFLTNNKKESFFPAHNKEQLFSSWQQDIRKNLAVSYNALKALIPNGNSSLVVKSAFTTLAPQPFADDEPESIGFFKLINYKDSLFRLNWTLLPMVLKTFKIITYIASAVIAIIALVALVICIKKTITFNSKQIGILKAMGTDPWMIAVTYLAYGIVIMFIVVPIAWFIASFCQIPFGYMFGNYFSIRTNVIDFNWQAFLIAFFGFGIIAMFISIFTAWLITRQSVLDIIKISTTWSNSRFIDFVKLKAFKNASFNTRFSLTLASSGKKPIILLTVVVGLASLLISGSLALPSIANNAVRSYYKNVHYANSYSNLIPTMNSPLSKPAINYWQGNEKWDKDWVSSQLELDSSGTKYGYYKEPSGYMDLVSQSSPIPRYIFAPELNDGQASSDNKYEFSNLTYTYPYVIETPEVFLGLAGEAFGNNFFTVLGQSFNIGTIDQFYGIILNGQPDLIKALMGSAYDDNLTLDANKQALAQNFSRALTAALPSIINSVINSISGTGGKGGDNWKESIINAILTQVPPYIKSFIYKSPSRLEQFGISFNAETYIPKRETLITNLPVDVNNYQGINVTGIDQSQDAYSLTNIEKQNMYLDLQTKNKIADIFAGKPLPQNDIYWGKTKVWNASTKTLTIPMVANRQAEAAYKLKHNKTLTNALTRTRQLTYRTNRGDVPWDILPKYAWVYDDQDFAKSQLLANPQDTLKTQRKVNTQDYQNSWKNSQNRFDDNWKDGTNPDRWMDMYRMDNNKFTYQNPYTQDQNLVNNAYLFSDLAIRNDNGQLVSSYLRPYFQYKNIKLFIPSDLANEEDLFHSSTNSSNKGPGENSYYETNVSGDEVPFSVKKAWGRENDSQTTYFMIRPYDLSYGDNSENEPGGLDRLTNGKKYPYWLRYAFDSETGPGALSYMQNAPVHYGSPNQAQNFQINFESVGTLVSYESKLLLIDSDVANMMMGYSNARSYGTQVSLFEGPGRVNTRDNQGYRPWDDKLLTFKLRNVEDDVYVNKNDLSKLTYLSNQQDAYNYAPLKWHTGKLSNVEEPEGLTSSVSFNVIDNLGQYSLGLLYTGGLGMTTLIENQVLLSSQKALINQIYSLTISIGMLLIIAILITASLLIMLVGDIYIAQYQQFMILMRALGYANWQIQSYAFGAVAIFSFLAWLLATIIAWVISYGVITSIANRGFAIPYGFSWWPPLLSLVIIAASFFGSLWVSSHKARTAPVSILMNESHE